VHDDVSGDDVTSLQQRQQQCTGVAAETVDVCEVVVVVGVDVISGELLGS